MISAETVASGHEEQRGRPLPRARSGESASRGEAARGTGAADIAVNDSDGRESRAVAETSRDELEVHRFSDELRAQFPDQRLGGFEGQVEDWQALFKRARGMAHFEEERLRETGKLTARRQIGHLAAATAIRTVDLASGLIVLLNATHAHASYPVARAIVETAGVPAYALRNVVPLVAKGRVERASETLLRMVLGLDPGVAAVFPEDVGRAKQVHPIRVSKIVDALAATATELHGAPDGKPVGDSLRHFYSNVSDHTHPNTGAMHLSASIDENGMSWTRPAQLDEGVMVDVVGTSSLALWYGERAMDSLLKAANEHRLVLADKLQG
jgi:hypothetical protein